MPPPNRKPPEAPEDQLRYLYGRVYLNEALTYLLLVHLGTDRVRKVQNLLIEMVKHGKDNGEQDQFYKQGVQDYFESVNTGLAKLLLSVEKEGSCKTGDGS